MNRYSRAFNLSFFVIFLIANSLLAQPVQERIVISSQDISAASVPVVLEFERTTLAPVYVRPAEFASQVSKQEGSEEIFLSDDPSALLPVMSNMLNQTVSSEASWSFEALRRNSIFQVEQTLVSQYLAFNASRKSA